jgi:hypothetical protein
VPDFQKALMYTPPPDNFAQLTFPGVSSISGPGILPDGDYTLTVPGGSVADLAGNAITTIHVLPFFVRAGDADHNGVVDFDDYVLIDNGFNNGLSGFGNGDFNYDGVIDFDDYVIIDLAFNSQ